MDDAVNLDVASGADRHRFGVDPAVDTDVSDRIEIFGAVGECFKRCWIDAAIAKEKAVGEGLGWCCQRQAAGIHHPVPADDDAIRVGDNGVAADAPVLIGVEDAGNGADLSSGHDVDQGIGPGWLDQVDRIAGIHTEPLESIDGIPVRHRRCRHRGRRGIDRIQLRAGAAIEYDLLRVGIKPGKRGQRAGRQENQIPAS